MFFNLSQNLRNKISRVDHGATRKNIIYVLLYYNHICSFMINKWTNQIMSLVTRRCL